MKSEVRCVTAAHEAVVLALFAVRAAVRPLSFTKSVEVDRETYHRLKTDLMSQGEPVPVDSVIGCHSRTVEAG